MATNNESDSEKNNDASVPSEAEQEGLSAEQAGEHTYSEAEAWKKSKNTLLTLLGLIAIGVAGYTFLNKSKCIDISDLVSLCTEAAQNEHVPLHLVRNSKKIVVNKLVSKCCFNDSEDTYL